MERPDADRAEQVRGIRSHLVDYLELKSPEDAERIGFVRAAELPGEFGEQFRFLDDGRLAETLVAVVPDDLWHKGGQPSESMAERGTVLVRGGYFGGEREAEKDPSAWMTHELAHCQRFADLEDEDEYGRESGTPAFSGLGPDTYPNNKVEEHAFGRQFAYLKEKGIERDQVADLLREHYGPEGFLFLDRILDRVFG